MAKKKPTSDYSIEHVKELAKDALKKGKKKVLTAALELAVALLHKVGTGEKVAKKATKKAGKTAKKATKKAVEKAKKTVKKAVKKTKKAASKKKATKK
jgi:hypothetical protein